jgi:hypothetical protein
MQIISALIKHVSSNHWRQWMGHPAGRLRSSWVLAVIWTILQLRRLCPATIFWNIPRQYCSRPNLPTSRCQQPTSNSTLTTQPNRSCVKHWSEADGPIHVAIQNSSPSNRRMRPASQWQPLGCHVGSIKHVHPMPKYILKVIIHRSIQSKSNRIARCNTEQSASDSKFFPHHRRSPSTSAAPPPSESHSAPPTQKWSPQWSNNPSGIVRWVKKQEPPQSCSWPFKITSAPNPHKSAPAESQADLAPASSKAHLYNQSFRAYLRTNIRLVLLDKDL